MASTHIERTFTAGNRDKWTLSMWVKRGNISSVQYMASFYQDNSNYTAVFFDSDDTLHYDNKIGGSAAGQRLPKRLFRDPSAFYHIVIVWDSGNATASERNNIYIRYKWAGYWQVSGWLPFTRRIASTGRCFKRQVTAKIFGRLD
mgnify:CR=1 FL=1